VLLSAYTVAALKEEHFLREVDSIRVKGKQEPVAIFQALDAFDEPTQAIYKSTEALHLEGMRLYQAQDWAAARARFEEVRKIHQEDAVASIYIKRCSHFESSPPAADWDGVWTMNTK
jgi:adenylate cyclase